MKKLKEAEKELPDIIEQYEDIQLLTNTIITVDQNLI
jgi:hypothetical protein